MVTSRTPTNGAATESRALHDDDGETARATATTTSAAKVVEAIEACGDRPAPPRLPVDRDWLQKLLRQHYPQFAPPNGGGDGTTAIHAYALAPMVDQSDLAFRLQCRRYGTNLCFTPMIHSKLFATDVRYRRKFALVAMAQDRPLIAQLCGSDCQHMLFTALAVAPYCDAIDINCGCPQGIARRGKYGAFLLEQEERLLQLIQHLLPHLTVPLTVKVRLLLPPEDKEHNNNPFQPTSCTTMTNVDDEQQQQQLQQRERSIQRSIQLYTKLVDAGIHMLTVHGRTRRHKGVGTGAADWDAIRRVVQALGRRIPILANGSLASPAQVRECLAFTGCDGVMSSEAILEYPPLFQGMMEQDHARAVAAAASTASGTAVDMSSSSSGRSCSNNVTIVPVPATTTNTAFRTVGRLDLALEYLDLAEQYPPERNGQGSGIKCIRVHVHRFLHADLQEQHDLRQDLVSARSVAELRQACLLLRQRHVAIQHDYRTEQLSWYMRHRNLIRDGYGNTVNLQENNNGDDDDDGGEGEDEEQLTSAEKEAQECEEAACFTSLFGEVDW